MSLIYYNKDNKTTTQQHNKNKNLRKGGTDRRRRKLCFIYKWKEIFFINETGKTYQIRRRCLHRGSIRLI